MGPHCVPISKVAGPFQFWTQLVNWSISAGPGAQWQVATPLYRHLGLTQAPAYCSKPHGGSFGQVQSAAWTAQCINHSLVVQSALDPTLSQYSSFCASLFLCLWAASEVKTRAHSHQVALTSVATIQLTNCFKVPKSLLWKIGLGAWLVTPHSVVKQSSATVCVRT